MRGSRRQKTVLGHGIRLLVLAGPLIANNLAIAGMGFADTVMAGRIGTRDLASVAVGSSVWMVVFLFGLGVLMAMSPTAAHAFGAGRNAEVGVYTRQCLWLSQALAIFSMWVLSHAGKVLNAVGVDPAVIPLTAGYLDAIAWGLPAMYAYLSLRFMSEGVGWTRPIMYAALLGLVVNVSGNWIFMYGKLGFPAMGAVGCGVASALSMWCMFGLMVAYVATQKHYRAFSLAAALELPNAARLRDLLGLGLPIAVSIVSEAGLFSAVAVLMGTLGATAVAAHQIAINFAGTMFMVPLAVHSALTIRVGHALGRGDPALGRRIGMIGIAMCGGLMVLSALMLLLFRSEIAAFYTSDSEVLPLAASLLTMAMIFQVSDGLQVGAAGALRGFKDTRIPMLINFGCYWLAAFPLAWYLGVKKEMGPQSVWIALILGLSLTALFLNLRFFAVARRRLRAAAV
ncbi:MAG: MATE family efflux transporter [Gammaproteobacteria bacterium]